MKTVNLFLCLFFATVGAAPRAFGTSATGVCGHALAKNNLTGLVAFLATRTENTENATVYLRLGAKPLPAARFGELRRILQEDFAVDLRKVARPLAPQVLQASGANLHLILGLIELQTAVGEPLVWLKSLPSVAVDVRAIERDLSERNYSFSLPDELVFVMPSSYFVKRLGHLEAASGVKFASVEIGELSELSAHLNDHPARVMWQGQSYFLVTQHLFHQARTLRSGDL